MRTVFWQAGMSAVSKGASSILPPSHESSHGPSGVTNAILGKESGMVPATFRRMKEKFSSHT